MTDESQGMLLGLAGIVIFSLTLPATRYVTPYLDPLFIALGRASTAAVVAVIILFIFRQPFPNKQQIKQLALIALGVVIGFPVLTSWAMITVEAAHAGVIIALLPLLTAIMGVLIAGERPSIYFWLISLFGAGLVVVYALLQSEQGFQFGDLLLFAGSLLGAFGYALGGKLSKQLGGWQVICWVLVVAFPFIIIPTLMTQPKGIFVIPDSVWVSFLYLAFMSQLFGFFFWYKGLAIGGIARISQIQLLQPFLTFLAAFILLGEGFDNTTFMFAIAVVLTISISQRMPITIQHERKNDVKNISG